MISALIRRLRRRPGDLAAVAVAIAVVAFLSIAVYAPDAGEATHVVVQSADGRFLYALSDDTTATFDGPIGTTVMRIEDGDVWIERDPGPLQICVRKGRISQADEWLACLPNEVFVRIAGAGTGDGLDGKAF
jgi:hypothetical protein